MGIQRPGARRAARDDVHDDDEARDDDNRGVDGDEVDEQDDSRRASSCGDDDRSDDANDRSARPPRRHGLVASPNVERRRASVRVSASADGAESMTRVCALEELPRGDRKLVRVLSKSILMFWYRDTVFAIESRSPAEGAYSEGFEKARLTQDACIECPTTKSKFDLKTGEIKEWYPENPVLKALTPQDTCRPMEVFPVEVR